MRKLNYLFWGIAVLWLGPQIAVFGQDVAYTQYYLNLPGVNPGFTGIEDYLDLKLAFRQGWNDFGVKNDNLFVSAYAPLGNSRRLSIKRNSLRISNVPAYEDEQTKGSLRRRHGIGGMMTSRTVGPYTSSNASLNYGYHLPVSRDFTVSLATKVGYGSQRIDFNGYTVRDEVNDSFYKQLVTAGSANQNAFSIDFGSVLYSSRFYVAFASSNLIRKNLDGNGLLNFGNRRQYVLQSAYTMKLSENFLLNTGLKVAHTDGYKLNWALNSRLRFKQLIYIGGGYDNVSKVSFLLGFAARGNFSLNYAYDHYLSNVGSLTASVHEVILGIALFNKFDSNTKLW